MKLDEGQSLEQVLESAVVMSWADLMPSVPNGLIHVRYGFAPGGTLDFLQIWLSITRGHWLLALSYWMSASRFHDAGVHFENGYQSDSLAHLLEMVMQNQHAFALPPNLGRQGLLQIAMPTEKERTEATASASSAVDCIGSPVAEPALA